MKMHQFALTLSIFLASSLAVAQQGAIWDMATGTPPKQEAEWMVLTTADQPIFTNSAHFRTVFNPADTIKVEFDYISWGGTNVGADGLAIYLFDADVPGAGTGGHHYSALGYCRLVGGYIGIGLDEYGNFAYSCENPVVDGDWAPNSASIRGSQARNYTIFKNFPVETQLDCEGAKCATRAKAISAGVKHVLTYFVPKRDGVGYSVSLAINGKMIFSGVDYPFKAPDKIKLGISASTGSYTNNHEIRQMVVGGARQCKKTI